MEHILLQTENCLDAGFYYPALISCLTIPDICGALNSDNGESNGEKYSAWYNRYVLPHIGDAITKVEGIDLPIKIKDSRLNGNECYWFRCSLLHQGRTDHKKSEYDRILFIEPNSGISIGHDNLINNVLHINMKVFCFSVIMGARSWLEECRESDNYKRNINKCVRSYENGFPPIKGVPVVT